MYFYTVSNTLSTFSYSKYISLWTNSFLFNTRYLRQSVANSRYNGVITRNQYILWSTVENSGFQFMSMNIQLIHTQWTMSITILVKLMRVFLHYFIWQVILEMVGCFASTPKNLAMAIACSLSGAVLLAVGAHLSYVNVEPQRAEPWLVISWS